MPSNEIFIETRRYKSIIRVTAIDATSGLEISFQAPASTAREVIRRLASSKMAYALRKGLDKKDDAP